MKTDVKKLLYLIITIFAVIYIITFTFLKNYEFVTYVVFVLLFIGIIFWTDKNFNYSIVSICGFCVWVIMHMLGGSLYVSSTRLYDVILIRLVDAPYYILKYDQFVHTFCYVVIAMLLYSVFKKSYKLTTSGFVFVILAAIGIGAINEIIEFSTVVFFNSTGVGDYTNNALDLVFNSIGATLGVFISSKFK